MGPLRPPLRPAGVKIMHRRQKLYSMYNAILHQFAMFRAHISFIYPWHLLFHDIHLSMIFNYRTYDIHLSSYPSYLLIDDIYLFMIFTYPCFLLSVFVNDFTCSYPLYFLIHEIYLLHPWYVGKVFVTLTYLLFWLIYDFHLFMILLIRDIYLFMIFLVKYIYLFMIFTYPWCSLIHDIYLLMIFIHDIHLFMIFTYSWWFFSNIFIYSWYLFNILPYSWYLIIHGIYLSATFTYP